LSVRKYIYRGGGGGGIEKCKKRKEKKLVRGKEQWWIGISAACIRREGVEVGSYDPQLLIHTSCLVQFRTEFSKLLLHHHTNTGSPRKNTLLSLSLSHRDSALY